MALWKPTKISVTTNIDIYMTLPNIWDGAFGKNIYAFEVINYIHKKFSVLDAWKGPRFTFGRGMIGIAKYINLYLSSGIWWWLSEWWPKIPHEMMCLDWNMPK